MLRKLLFISGIILLHAPAFAQTPVWSTKIAPILYNNCTSCHRPGGIAPFSLVNYSDAVTNSRTMKSDVQGGIMPPWPPDPTYSHLAHERILADSDIATIAAWVDGGTPEGDPALAPPIPVYSTHGMIPGTPDLIVRIPTYTSTAATGDVYQCFVLPSHLATDKYISRFEAVPGNPACVHHVLVYADTTGTCAALEAASTTPPGYPDFGGVGSSSATMLGVWVPGSQPMSYPAGFGLKIPHNADIVVQVHYPAGTGGLTDSTEIHFFFAPSAGIREVFLDPILYHDLDMTDGPLSIPADSVKTFHELFPAPFASTLLGAFPHMHLIGKTIESYGVLPSGDTDKYIKVNNWDFHWQGFYMFPKMKKVPAGTQMRAQATYDNTTANPQNPFRPPINVVAGESTTNEMMIVFFVWTYYQAGDENIIIDSSVLSTPNVPASRYYHGEQLLDVSPNPAASNLMVKCYMENTDIGTIELADMQGKVVRRFTDNTILAQGYTVYNFSVQDILPGNYSLVIRTSRQVLSKKIVVVR